MPLQRLIGNEWSSVPTSSRLPSYYGANKYTVLATGVVKIFKNYSITSGELKVAAHLDNGSDHPGALLASNDTGVACTGSSWNDIPIDDFAVTQNDEVWLGGNCDTNGTLSSSAGGTLKYVSASYASWTASDPSVNLPNTYGHTVGLQAWGYIPPSISGINSGNPINPGGSLSCVGSDFETVQGSGKLELCNNINYASATIKVEQTISTWVDDTITGTVVQGSLSLGTVYAFVTTDSNQRNSVGFAVTLSASVNACTIAFQSPASILTVNGTQSNQASMSGFSPASEVSITATNTNSASVDIFSPASEVSVTVTNTNNAAVNTYSPASEASVTATNTNSALVDIFSPASEHNIIATQENEALVTVFSPASEFKGIATNFGVNNASVDIFSPASQASVLATQQNSITVNLSSPASEFNSIATNAKVNNASVNIFSPASQAFVLATQQNSATVDISSPASVVKIIATNEGTFMPGKVFIGSEVSSGSNTYADIHYLCHCIAYYSGMLTKIGVFSNGPGNIKINLYEIVGGVPQNLIFADNVGFACSAGINTIDISAHKIMVQAGNQYAIGGVCDDAAVITLRSEVSARTYKAENYATFTAPDPIAGYTTQDPYNYVYNYVAYGWEPPSILSVSHNEIYKGQGVSLTGINFMDTGATLELCNDSIYASATKKIAQDIRYQSDNLLEFRVVEDDLAYETNYFFIITDLGQMNSIGYPVILKPSYRINMMPLFGGYGQVAVGRHQYGAANSLIEPRYDVSVPQDEAVSVSRNQWITFSTYHYSSIGDFVNGLTIEISEDNGNSFSLVKSPIYELVSRVKDGQRFWFKIRKITGKWPPSSWIIIRYTGMDEHGNIATKIEPVRWD